MAERLELVRECFAADPMGACGVVIALPAIHWLTAQPAGARVDVFGNGLAEVAIVFCHAQFAVR
ncbi:hypothetical protein [Cupriavidus sp. HMR-1]|uniref:hypothetical protein n=1 Tax=Cupriavidus sp. HMR-1 TaxID=1249621 RepID=UPI00126745CF|nr:hypothetical protein [Cupriavidus sp. HMR-1]